MKTCYRWKRLALGLAGLAAAATAPIACSGDGGREPSTKAPADPKASEWAIHIYVGKPGASKRVDLRPVSEISFPQQGGVAAGPPLPDSPEDLWKTPPSPPGPATGSSGPGSKPLAVVDGKDGGVEFEQDLQDISGTGWALVWGAATECGMRGIGGGNPLIGGSAQVPPWRHVGNGKYAWSIFEKAPESCDQAVAFSETLLCVASELSKAAEAVAPITWSKISSTPFDGFPSGPWTIPVQSNKDKFVLRDLGIYVLANLALNDMRVPGVGNPGGTTCSEAYAKAAAEPAVYGLNNASYLFGVAQNETAKYFPPLDPAKRTVKTENIPDLVKARLRFNTMGVRISRILDHSDRLRG